MKDKSPLQMNNFLTKGLANDLGGSDELLPQGEADAVLDDKYYGAQLRVGELYNAIVGIIYSVGNGLHPNYYPVL